ncbi:MAG: hypothetical protein AAB401_18240 [Acidobacteriota bacterium]
MNKPFPERCLRGLRDEKFIERDQNGSVLCISELAFKPPTNKNNLEDRVSKRNKSNHYESSINWEDDAAESFQTLCEDKKNAGQGIVSICLADLKIAKQVNPLAATSFDWEREQIKGNPYHGNLLFSGELPLPMVRMLAAVIATHVQPNLILIEPENYNSELAARATQTTGASKMEHSGFWRHVLDYLRLLFRT